MRVGWLCWLERETLDVAICSSGSKARTRHTQSIAGREVVV